MRSARAARLHPPTTTTPTHRVGDPPQATPSALHRSWYLPESTATSRPLPADLAAALDTILAPHMTPDAAIATLVGVALRALGHLRAAVAEAHQPLTIGEVADLLTGLTLAQAHLVQDAQDLARYLTTPPPPGAMSFLPAAYTLAEHLSDAARHGELAAALLHEGRLLLPSP